MHGADMDTIRSPIATTDDGVIGPGNRGNTSRLICEIRQWLEAFSDAVRRADCEQGRQLFAPDVYAFGTRVHIADGIDELVAQQWQPTWSITRGYRFDLDQMCCGGEIDTAWAAAPWQSQGQRGDGSWFDRRGRATFILQRTSDGWRAVHSHHSIDPR